jgi:hypothetical protein
VLGNQLDQVWTNLELRRGVEIKQHFVSDHHMIICDLILEKEGGAPILDSQKTFHTQQDIRLE